MENELQTAWDNATSIPPGQGCNGRYIGSIEKVGRIFEFYAVEGGYKYISYAKGEKHR